MATVTNNNLASVLDNISKLITNENINHNPLLNQLESHGRIRRNSNMFDFGHRLKAFDATDTLTTFGVDTPRNIQQRGTNITATWTRGQYVDSVFIDKLQDMLEANAGFTLLYNTAKESIKDLARTSRQQFDKQLRAADGTAIGPEADGQSMIGSDAVLLSSATSAGGIAYSGNAWWTPAFIDADAGPSTDFDADRYERFQAFHRATTLFQEGKRISANQVGFMSHQLMQRMVRSEFLLATTGNHFNKGTDSASIGVKNDHVLEIDGVNYFVDNGLASNTVELWDMDHVFLDLIGSNIWKTKFGVQGDKVLDPGFMEMTAIARLRWDRLRTSGSMRNANA